MACKDCNDTRKYQPLIGPSEPCLACQDPLVYAGGAFVEHKVSDHDFIKAKKQEMMNHISQDMQNAMVKISEAQGIRPDIDIKVMIIHDIIVELRMKLTKASIGCCDDDNISLRSAFGHTDTITSALRNIMRQVESLKS